MSSYKRPFPPKRIPKRTGFIQFENTAEGKALQKSMNRGFNLATVIAGGNYETRNFRQKPIVMLETATHTPNPNRKFSQKAVVPVVVAKNTLLPTSTTMPVVYKKAFPPKKVSKKASTNRKNVKPTKAKPKTVTQSLVKDVKDLKKTVNNLNALHIHKRVAQGSLKSLIGRCNHYSWQGNSVSLIETALTNLRYFDPANPATLVTANASTGTYGRDFTIKNAYSKFFMRNNYQVPVRVKLYLCKAKLDGSETALTTYTNAISDQVINAGIDETDALLYLTDIERVKESWEIDCVVDKVLEPGQEASATHSTGSFTFDPSHVDLITDIYQKAYKSYEWMLRVEGVLGHDTSANEISILNAGVDMQITWRYDIQYNSGGASLEDIYLTDPRPQAFTNGGVVSLKPVADNIAYSVS